MVRETNAGLDLRPMPSSARRPASQRRRTALIHRRLQLFDLGPDTATRGERVWQRPRASAVDPRGSTTPSGSSPVRRWPGKTPWKPR